LKHAVNMLQRRHVVGWILSLQSPHRRADRG
jgi:hypothetical protein